MSTRATPRFTMQLAVLSQPAGVDGVRTVARSKMTVQQVFQPGGKVSNALLTGTATAATGSVTCADADFTTGTTVLTIGPYTLTSNVEYVTGTAAQTATALAAAVARLPEFGATVDGGDNTKVNVTGPFGPDGGKMVLKVMYNGSVVNFTLAPTTGFFAVGGPIVGPPTF